MKRNKHLLSLMTVVFVIIMLIFTACVRQKVTPPIGDDNPPSAVINIYPVLSELVDENNFYAKWTKSVDPEGKDITYIVNFAKSIEGLDDPNYYETKENYFLMPNLSEGVWYWQVTARDIAGNKTPSPVWNFTINGEGLPQPADPEELPPDPVLIISQVENTSFTLDWPAYEDKQNPSNIIQYTINVYEKDTFSESRNEQDLVRWLSRIEPATTAHTTDTIHRFQNMKSETFYDWVIIAQNNASQTSVVGSSGVKTGNRPPTQPELIGPTDGATTVATDVTLSWSASTDPDGDLFKYYVYIDIVRNTNRNVTVEGIEQTRYQPAGIEKGRTYYWFILVKDDNGAATRTQTQSFMTESDGMDIPHTPSPADGSQAINALDLPLLQWEHDKNDQTITYSVYLSSNPKTISLAKEDLDQQQYQIQEALQGNTTYYWQVEAVNTQNGNTTKSGVWTFKTDIIPSPTQTHAVTNREGTQIELTYDKAMADPAGKHNQYTVKKNSDTAQNNRQEETLTTTKIELKPGTNNQYLLSLETPVQTTDEITIDYTQGNIKAQDGSFLESYTDKPVTNQVPGQKPILNTAIINSDGQTIDLGFDKAMQAPTATEYEQFGVLVNGYVNEITAAELKTDEAEHIIITLKYPIGKNNQVHVSYTRGTIQSTDGAYLESFQNKLVSTDNLKVIWVVKDIGWNYDTIQTAIDAAEDEATVMVWPGRYKESLTIDKPIHLMSSDPASETVQATTIIDGNEELVVVTIGSEEYASERSYSPEGTVTIEGFTITNAMGAVYSSGERNRSAEIAAGIIVNNMNTEIRNNIITKNGTDTSNRGARGIYVNAQSAEVKIHDNTISHNIYTGSYFTSMERGSIENDPRGAGICVAFGSPEIYANTISYNTSDGNGGGICIGSPMRSSSVRVDLTAQASPVLYNNEIKYNTAVNGAGVYIYLNMDVLNADNEKWERDNYPNVDPNVTVNDVEGNTLPASDNTYEGNMLQEIRSSERNRQADENGRDICFEYIPSTNTDFNLTGDNPELIQFKTTGSATSLLVACDTTVATVLANIESADGSNQIHIIYNSSSSKENPLADDAQLTEDATLVVTSEEGAPDEKEYAIDINPTKFVKLYSLPNDLSVSRERNGRSAQPETTWHETIADAVASASTDEMSTITVWPGIYVENITISKPIHLRSTDLASETTIIDGDALGSAIAIISPEPDISTSRDVPIQVIIEGFTITGAEGGGKVSLRKDAPIAAVYVSDITATIRNNLITENGTWTGDEDSSVLGCGVLLENSHSLIYDNVISKNVNDRGGGICIWGGSPQIYSNQMTDNYAYVSGAGVYVTLGSSPTIYGNQIKNNTASCVAINGKGAGIYICSDCVVKNADGDEWNKQNYPNAAGTNTVNDVEGNNTPSNNNEYDGNQLESGFSISERTDPNPEEGKDIYFYIPI